MRITGGLVLGAMWVMTMAARGAVPPPAREMTPWATPWEEDVPGVMSAAALIEKPAGKHGPIHVRDGHFFEGEDRIRFWGATVAFSGALPSHDQADATAKRLAHFGINAVRVHHVDMQPFPNGLFADDSLEKLSPQGIDRLDYFLAALAAQGIYTDLNLHVSRWWSRAHHWPNAEKIPEFDKIVDLYDPKLIAADKQYARDLLTHINPYTHRGYADDPAICFLEINNENTMFLWGGERQIANLPDPFGAQLTALWNQWLARKYGAREKLRAAWSAGVKPAGPNLLIDPEFAGLNGGVSPWRMEQHDTSKASAAPAREDASHPGVKVDVTAADGVGWHIQFQQAELKLKKGRLYSLSFDVEMSHPGRMGVGVSQAHEPWQPLGFQDSFEPGAGWTHYQFGLTAPADDDNARVSFQLGEHPNSIQIANVRFTENGQVALAQSEDPATSTVARGFPNQGYAPSRLRDWYAFLQQTDEAYFVAMRQFLKEELGVKCPITGTIGLGPLGTLSQSRMDFVDAHAYWDHPQFPHRSWDSRDWMIRNDAMVDSPAANVLAGLAATRVAGLPFTVTEYNHAAPNEWQAECVPLIATFAALQDWDAVFLFDYAAGNDYQHMDHTSGYFDIEGNPLKMNLLPIGARLFLAGGVMPLAGQRIVSPMREQMLDTGSQYYWEMGSFVQNVLSVKPDDLLRKRLSVNFSNRATQGVDARDSRASWTGDGPNTGTGRFTLNDPHAAVFVGFSNGPMPIDLGSVLIEKLDTPFATLILTPATPGESIATAKRLLLTAVARGGNTGMQWNADRHSVADHWGEAPGLVEVVRGTIRIAGPPFHIFALAPAGKRGAELKVTTGSGATTVELGAEKSIWYELVRE